MNGDDTSISPKHAPPPHLFVHVDDDRKTHNDEQTTTTTTSAITRSDPDVVQDRPRPDLVPSSGGPDVVSIGQHPQQPSPPEVVQDSQFRWSGSEGDDDDFGDAAGADDAEDINIDELNLDDED